jgi:hypothetical protein
VKSAAVLAVIGGLAVATPTLAQELTRADLEAALRQRDQEISALEKRIAALEGERATAAAPIQTLPASAETPSAGTASATRPGADEVALEALTRGLVQRGALVIPTWSLEVAPSLSYSHSQTQGLVLVNTPEGISTVSDQRQRNDPGEARLAIRLGLPWRSQIEVRVPFDWKRQDSALGDGTNVFNSEKDVGDVEVELSHQFLVEKGWMPDLVGALSWRFPTGQDPFRVPVANLASGGGVNTFTGRLTALKSFDPLVVFSTLAYSGALSRDETFGRVLPGNVLDWQMGAILAVNPGTSLSFAFVQDFKGNTRVAGVPIAGSNGVAAVAQIGLDQVLSSRALLDVTLGFGVTRDAPDYQLMVSVPIRFW